MIATLTRHRLIFAALACILLAILLCDGPCLPKDVDAGNTDIGNAATDRASYGPDGYTRIDKGNPATANFMIVTVEIYAVTGYNLTDCKVGTFYNTTGQTYVCRDSATLGTVTGGSKQTFNSLEIEAQTGDFIGIYYSAGRLEWGSGGSTITMYSATGGDFCDPEDSTTYTNSNTGAYSLYGTGNPQITCTTTAATLVSTNGARLNGSLVQTTGTNCNCTMYYGDTDGGTTAESWDNYSLATSPSQPQASGTFYANVHDLSDGILYYCRSFATDGTDSVWAASGQTFTTLEGSTAGTQGEQGQQGEKGEQGEQGEQGPAGTGGGFDWEGADMQLFLMIVLGIILFIIGAALRNPLVIVCSCFAFIGIGITGDNFYIQIVGGLMSAVTALIALRFFMRGRIA